jgi:hypothetical protein
VLSGSGLGEEGVEAIIASSDGLVRRHLAVRLDSVLEAVQLPTCIPNLNSPLTYMDVNNFSHPIIVLYTQTLILIGFFMK